MKYPIIYLILCIQLLSAQSSFLFESRVYFEDAAGNRDTIYIAYDTLANSEYNPTLGELHLNEAFNPIFEVRASHLLAWDQNFRECILSKKIISAVEQYFDPMIPGRVCYGAEGIIFFIKAKYPPVKLSWDSTLFQKTSRTCDSKSFFTPDFNYHASNPFTWILWPHKRFACAGKQSEFVVNLEPDYIRTYYPNEATYYTSRVFSNGINDTIYGLELIFEDRDEVSPCRLVSHTNEQEESKINQDAMIIFPNPALDKIKLEFKELQIVYDLSVFDQHGNLVKKIKMPESPFKEFILDTKELKDGLYFIHLKLEKGISLSKTFVVMNSLR